MQAGKFNLKGLITHEFKLDQINDAIAIVKSGDAGRVLVAMED
jgi:S-(hydroxymethyl)glutathione dehydrogenase/alcohol dehydrogenase